MLSHPLVKCSKTLASSASAAPLDVLKTKSVLKSLGHYDAPEWGLSPYPDPTLFQAIADFQRANGLKVDGVMKPDGETENALGQSLTPRTTKTAVRETAQTLQAMGRGGDEILAHITPEEARLLHTITDGGSINPDTGLMEFKYGGSGSRGSREADRSRDGGGVGSSKGGDGSPSRGRSFDASADHKSNQRSTNVGDGNGIGSGKGGDGSPSGSRSFDASADHKANDSSNGTTTGAQTEDGTLSKTAGRNNQAHSGNAVDNSFTAGMLDTNAPEDEDEDDWDSSLLGEDDAPSETVSNAPDAPSTPEGNAGVGSLVDLNKVNIDPAPNQHKTSSNIQVAGGPQKTSEEKEYERYMQRFYPGYTFRGNNLFTNYNNPQGVKKSKKALGDAISIESQIKGGQALQGIGSITKGPAGSSMGVAGSAMEENGRRQRRDFLSPDYNRLSKSTDDEDRW